MDIIGIIPEFFLPVKELLETYEASHVAIVSLIFAMHFAKRKITTKNKHPAMYIRIAKKRRMVSINYYYHRKKVTRKQINNKTNAPGNVPEKL